MTNHDALKLVFERNLFYKRLHFLVLGALTLSLIAIGLLLTMLIYLHRNPTHPIYFATDEVGRLIPIVPVNQPNMTTAEVTAWTVQAIEKSYSYDYINFRAQLQEAERYYSTYGWTKYMNGLRASNNLVALVERKQVVVSRIIAPPKLVTEGILGGAHAWKFRLQLLVTYSQPPYDDKSKYSNALDVEVIVQRQPILQSYKGLGILQTVYSFASMPGSAPKEISAAPAS